MDELESLGGSLGGLGGGGGGYSASSAATSSNTTSVNANTDFNFGSGTINDAPTAIASNVAPIARPSLSTPSTSYATPLGTTSLNAGAIAQANNSVFSKKNALPVVVIGIAIVAWLVISHK